jgi:hypothetical protein
MNGKTWRFLAVGVTACMACSWATAAGEAAGQADADGFVSIFNGKDLTGWDGDPALWSAVDGVLRGQTTKEHAAQGNTFCIWQGGKPANFILKLKVRYTSGNSGVQYRSVQVPSKAGTKNKWVMSGYQAEVRELGGKADGLYKIGGTYMEKAAGGYLTAFSQFSVVEGENGKVAKKVIGQVCDSDLLDKPGFYQEKGWNEYVLVCMGDYVEQYVNGRLASAYIDGRKQGRALSGLIGLQIHAGGPMIVEFKDICLKNLPEKYGDAVLLFNGKDLAGWKPSSDALKGAFSVAGGAIATTGKPAGYLRTEAQYTNYVLRCQLRHHADCNGGVLVRVHGQDKVWPDSIECQGEKNSMGDIWNIGEFPMKVDPQRTKGRQTVKLHPSNERPVGQWNDYEIYLNKGDLVIKVNGLVQNIATECKEIPGHIALQSEGGALDYRNIVLVPILDGKPAEAGK